MPKIIDLNESPQQKHRRSVVLPLSLALIALFVILRYSLSYWIDLLWFRSLGYDQAFWTTWRLRTLVFLAFAIMTFSFLYAVFAMLRRTFGDQLSPRHKLMISGQEVQFSVAPVLSIASWAVPLMFAIGNGVSTSAQWLSFALYFKAPTTSNITDPIFNRPLNFYLFTLPVWDVLTSWLSMMAVIACVLCVVFVVLAGGIGALNKSSFRSDLSPWRPLSVTLAFSLAVIAVNTYVSRFHSILEHHTIFDGVTYTDAHITLPGLLLVVLACLLGTAIAAKNAMGASRAKNLVFAIIPAAGLYALISVVGLYVDNFVVKPNELVRERPYIANNIASTRQAFGLDKFVQRQFAAETSIDAADPVHNQPTLQNIRLWDWRALQDTLRQVQEIRTYYDFPDIDIDRYNINGTIQQVMLATRELNIEKLPESSRNWINEKLIYTHGYGITMNPVNGFTSEGLPSLMLSNMPVHSTVPGLTVTRPEIYFGELTNTDVYVKTRQQEFDYPQGQTNSLTSYQGVGGIALGGFLRRVIIALDRDDLGKLPFSDDVNTESRLLMRRNIRERVAMLAPFLTFERDPYIVVGKDGRLSWIIDAFTTSDSYPGATHYSLETDSVNYIRNSVKAVIDAYTGATTFYVFDTNDPVIAAYRQIFPTLFRDSSAMPADLKEHVRYPELLFRTQSEVYGLYHMTNPEVFFNREDLWTVATEAGADANGQQATVPMHPNFVLMKLPEEQSEEFVEIIPFTPANRNNLIGWIAGRSDGAHYGTAIVYDFPKTRLVDGPQQIEARIDQNAQLSGQLTLWNQQGSHVLRGSLLVIPMGHALLYAEPIYLQAQQSPMPELRIVVLALQDKLAYGSTFESALTSLFGGQGTSPTGADALAASPPRTTTSQNAPSDLTSLITQAGKAFNDYQRLTAAGKLAEAGQKLDDLKQTLDKLAASGHVRSQ